MTRLSTRMRAAAILLSLAFLLPGLTSCAGGWDWLWSRDGDTLPAIDSDLLHVDTQGDIPPADETTPDAPRFEFDGNSIQAGTGIRHEAPAESPNRGLCVVIDAAHQQSPNSQTESIGPYASETSVKATMGAVGSHTGQREHQLNLAVALELRNELARRGYSVVMIRETANVNISNKERAELANAVAEDFDGTIYIRIHAANSEDAAERGAIAVCQSKENPYRTCLSHRERSRLLSELVLENYCAASHSRKHSTPIMENDTLTSTNWSRIPTTAVILGFLSHETEDTLMRYDEFRKDAAMGLANGIESYFRRVAGLDDDDPLPPDTIAVTEATDTPVTAPESTPATPTESLPDTQPEGTPVDTRPESSTETPSESIPEDTVTEPVPGTDYPTDVLYDFDENVTHEGVNIHYAALVASTNAHRCVVIDAGHQIQGNSDKEPNGPGSDVLKNKVTAGATGQFTGQLEHELNLAVALYLRNELVARGYNVVMVRESAEVDISNVERAQIANAYRSRYDEVILIRLHGNGASNPDAAGALVMFQSAANPYPDCAAQYAESRRLSLSILDGYEGRSGIPRRSYHAMETDTMTGINWSQVPATILEMGFLSNEGDDRLMATDEFRRSAAAGIADGVDAYFSHPIV